MIEPYIPQTPRTEAAPTSEPIPQSALQRLRIMFQRFLAKNENETGAPNNVINFPRIQPSPEQVSRMQGDLQCSARKVLSSPESLTFLESNGVHNATFRIYRLLSLLKIDTDMRFPQTVISIISISKDLFPLNDPELPDEITDFVVSLEAMYDSIMPVIQAHAAAA